jgi:hypothetical protein
LTTLHSIAAENASTIIFPLPMDLMRAFQPRDPVEINPND